MHVKFERVLRASSRHQYVVATPEPRPQTLDRIHCKSAREISHRDRTSFLAASRPVHLRSSRSFGVCTAERRSLRVRVLRREKVPHLTMTPEADGGAVASSTGSVTVMMCCAPATSSSCGIETGKSASFVSPSNQLHLRVLVEKWSSGEGERVGEIYNRARADAAALVHLPDSVLIGFVAQSHPLLECRLGWHVGRCVAQWHVLRRPSPHILPSEQFLELC
ncbi:hypothetical protein BC835DRAFT_1375947 [Cytidiella melzeri]|nr:hypothetical protein BC835DRAFT_1375947 [Cytidiella melzeri]